MKTITKIFLEIIIVTSLPLSLLAQQDTLYFDPASGNYVIQYLGETEEGNDTVVTITFEPATKIQPGIKCSMSSDSEGSILLYSYRIENGQGAVQPINRFLIDIGSIEVTVMPNILGWRIAQQRKLHSDSWYFLNRWAWSGTGEHSLAPGSSKEGFIIQSIGLPGIMNAYFRGRTPILATPAGGTSLELDKQIDALLVFPADHVIKKTISPTAPPSQFNKFNFLDTIKSYINQSRSLGWIVDTITRNKYTTLMDSARHEMERFYSDGARPVFDTVLQHVVTDTAQALLSSEAYALIRFNTEYLRDHLPPSYTLTLPIIGGGTVTKSLDNPTYDSSAVVHLTATPSNGYIFSGWSGNTSGIADTITVTMNNNKNITATFVRK